MSNKFTKYYIFTVITAFILLQLSLCQFIDTQVSYEYNKSQIKDDEIYILDEFTNLVEKYYNISNFSYEHNELDIPIKIHFIFETIYFSGESNYKKIGCQFIISNSNDQFYYNKNLTLPYYKGKTIYHNESTYDALASLFDYYAYLFIAYELDSYKLFLGNYYYSKALEVCSMGESLGSTSKWDSRMEKIKEIKNNEYLRIVRFTFYDIMDKMYVEEYNNKEKNELAKTMLENFKFIHNKLGYDKNTLKFIDAFHKEITEIFITFEIKDGVKFLYSFDDKNKTYYEKYLSTNEN